MKRLVLCCIVINIFISCASKKEVERGPASELLIPSELPGNALALMHCGKCHAFVSPEILSKDIWRLSVLPSMGHRLGIYKGDHQPDSLFDKDIGGSIVRKANIYPETPVMAMADWNKIIDYYVENAPDTILPPKRSKKIKMGLKHFKYKETSFSHRPTQTVLVKILPDNRGIVYSDSKRYHQSVYNLTFLDTNLKLDYEATLNSAPIHFYERSDTLFLATIGTTMFPHDAPNGTLQKIYRNQPGSPGRTTKEIIKYLQRPVFLEYADFNNDGREDILVCEYGNLTGKLVWYENQGNDQYSMRPLRGLPGAISAVIKDTNGDGFLDILVLMAQGDEGVFLYENRGNGTFTEKRLLTFLPLFGSQYIEMADFDGDGFDDLIYVCGDNADRTPILKSFHGIYIYLNDGNYNFTKKYFYQMNGAYKAIVRDFDLDGDLDIAAISFFPDYRSYPEESFIYLENKGDFEFIDYSFPESTNGRWIVMDANDMDADGDIDLAIGSFVYFLPDGDTTGLGNKWLKTGPSIAILENTIR
jgi:hypothetical protein